MSKLEPEYWKYKSFGQMSLDEWEALCDGCGQCCLHKLEDEDSSEIFYTEVACRLLDTKSCRCTKYSARKKLVPDCVILKPENVDQFNWLPKTCAYRLLSEAKELFSWHPLISGSPNSVQDAGISVKGKIISERSAGDLQDHIIDLDDF